MRALLCEIVIENYVTNSGINMTHGEVILRFKVKDAKITTVYENFEKSNKILEIFSKSDKIQVGQ